MGVRYREYIEAQRFGRTLFKARSDKESVFQVDLRAAEVNKKFTEITRSIKDPKKRREIMKEGAKYVVYAARSKAPRSRKVHYLYTGVTKLISNIKAAKGSVSDKRIKIYPGNLQLSIQYLDRLRRTPNAIIGPKIVNNPRAKSYGKNERNTNAYYAQMIYGSAEAFRNKVMIPALNQASSKVVSVVGRLAREEIRKAARKAGA